MGNSWQIKAWPAELEQDRSLALGAAKLALTLVDAALEDRGCGHEAQARARAAFRAAQGLCLVAAEWQRPVGQRWPRRLTALRQLVSQNAAAGVDLLDGLAAQNGGGERRRLLLDLLSLLSDLVYYLDVMGRRVNGGTNGNHT